MTTVTNVVPIGAWLNEGIREYNDAALIKRFKEQAEEGEAPGEVTYEFGRMEPDPDNPGTMAWSEAEVETASVVRLRVEAQ